jgi:hypothetical protein
MNKSYHNTTPLSGGQLSSAQKKAQTEDDLILQYFRNHPTDEFSPCQLWKILGQHKPITNWRRAVTNLTNAGQLEKTGKQIEGVYGRPVNTWRLVVKSPTQGSLF